MSGITANEDVCRGYVERSIGVVTALVPRIGYDRGVAIAQEALASGRSVCELVREKGWLDDEELERLLAPEAMTDPRRPSDGRRCLSGFLHRGAPSNKPSRSGPQQTEQATRAPAGSTTSTPPRPRRAGAVEGSAAVPVVARRSPLAGAGSDWDKRR